MYLVFSKQKLLGKGTITEAASIAKEHYDSTEVIVLDETTFQPVDLDLSGSIDSVIQKAMKPYFMDLMLISPRFDILR